MLAVGLHELQVDTDMSKETKPISKNNFEVGLFSVLLSWTVGYYFPDLSFPSVVLSALVVMVVKRLTDFPWPGAVLTHVMCAGLGGYAISYPDGIEFIFVRLFGIAFAATVIAFICSD
mgnify:CR=1 FL=1